MSQHGRHPLDTAAWVREQQLIHAHTISAARPVVLRGSFLVLPTKLRNRIYEMVLGGETQLLDDLLLHSSESFFQASCGKRFVYPVPDHCLYTPSLDAYLALCLVSRQVYREVRQPLVPLAVTFLADRRREDMRRGLEENR